MEVSLTVVIVRRRGLGHLGLYYITVQKVPAEDLSAANPTNGAKFLNGRYKFRITELRLTQLGVRLCSPQSEAMVAIFN